MSKRDWIVCQIGAREHYVIAAELHRRGLLRALCTDTWAGPGTLLRLASSIAGNSAQNIRDRYTPHLQDALVLSESPLTTALEAARKGLGQVKADCQSMMQANRRFASTMAERLKKGRLFESAGAKPPAVFAYSYGALEILRAAKAAGCLTLLGQIDPGPEEDRLVASQARKRGLHVTAEGKWPEQYWELWREEVSCSDFVIANSKWSAELLTRGGVPENKIRVVPLAYQTAAASGDLSAAGTNARVYPARFTLDRPLELLFLGQAGIRKGIIELVEAMDRLQGQPIRLSVVGAASPEVSQHKGSNAMIAWLGQRPRSEVAAFFRQSHAFILPTYSDGFGLTQLEALAEETPIIASSFCGDVVQHGIQGLVIESVTPSAIEEALRWAIANPRALAGMSGQCRPRLAAFTPASVVDALQAHSETAP